MKQESNQPGALHQFSTADLQHAVTIRSATLLDAAHQEIPDRLHHWPHASANSPQDYISMNKEGYKQVICQERQTPPACVRGQPYRILSFPLF